jgi:Holliday junction resolvasome RuvABC endonuclease subunit
VITISNAYSTAPQRLIANTRFEAPDGKMYRIHDSVDVPGATKKADGTLMPGTMSITVYADSPGAEYNRGLTTFTIPGFKGDPRYSKFSAQAQAITNGFVGNEPVVATADLQKAQNDLQKGLTDALQNAASTQIPKEFMLVPGTLKVTFSNITKTPLANGTVNLSQTAQASGYVIRMSDLAAVVAKQKIQGYNGEAVAFADTAQVAVSLSSTSTPGLITLALSGSPNIVWQFDPNSLKQALVGKPKSAFETIVQSFAPAIECTKDTPCKASVRPFWSSSFPSDASKITIVTGQ